MAGLLKQLNDEQLEEVRHLIRRDAKTDFEIFETVEKMLRRKVDLTAHAKETTIFRYRRGKEFRRWLEKWEAAHFEEHKVLAQQKERFEFFSEALKGTPEDGLNAISRGIQARLLTLAAETSDEELKESKWVGKVVRMVQEQAKVEKDGQVDALKAEIARLSGATGKAIDAKVLVAKVDDLMGLRKPTPPRNAATLRGG